MEDLCEKFNNNLKIEEDENIIKIQKIVRGYNIRKNMKVLSQILLDDIKYLDIDLLKIYIKNYMTKERLEYYSSTSSKNFELETGFSEYWIAKITKGKRIGEGNCPMDVITKNNDIIDVMCLCLNGNYTNEKSIMQNFGSSGNNLDELFKKNIDKALKLYIERYYEKINICIKKYNSKNVFYYIFISTNKNIYLSIFKINIKYIYNIIGYNITKQEKSINFGNFVDNNLGVTKLYKSKKRMELRLHRSVLELNNTILLY